MTTIAERDAAIAADLNEILGRHLSRVPAALTRDLAEFTSSYAARQVDRHARSPRSQTDPYRRRGENERKSA